MALQTYESISHDLKSNVGVVPGETIILHSSFKSLGKIEGGAETFIKAVCDVLTPEGTLLMPSFSHPTEDRYFDMLTMPSRTGYITEVFRRLPDSIRSQHPTHSVCAWGKRASEFVAGHENTSAIGKDSPFHKAAKAGARVIMVGCDFRSLSLVHVSEAIVRVPYLGKVFYKDGDVTLTLRKDDGSEVKVPGFDKPLDSEGFSRLQDYMEEKRKIEKSKVGLATTLYCSAAEVLSNAVALLKENSGYFLCDSPSCPVCPKCKEIIGFTLKR